MGKVYEALSRAESERNPLDDDIDDIEVEDAREIRNARRHDEDDIEVEDARKNRHVYHDDDDDDDESGSFNFLRYSLNAASLFERDHTKLVRRSQAQPTREVTIDFNRIDPHLAAFYNFDRRAAEQYNKLALTLISRAAERGFRRVLVASAQHGEGRTSVTLNLACALARARQRVLVVDCDLLKPSVMRALGLPCELGMVEAFTAGMMPGAAAIRVMPYGFNVLPTRKRVDNPVEILAAPGFWRMLQTFDAEHDFILFDSSPLLEIGDSSLLARFTDTTLLVVRSGQLSAADMAKAIAPFSPADLLGVVMNRAQS